MANSSDITTGTILALDGEHFRVLDAAADGPGSVVATLRSLASGALCSRRFRAGERVETASVERRDLQYLYAAGGLHHFMDVASYEQTAVEAHVVADALPFLRETDTLCMELLGGRPVGVLLPDVVELEVAGTGPGADDEIASGVFKDAVLETGATVRVPLFVVTGDRIRVDTRTARFVERVP